MRGRNIVRAYAYGSDGVAQGAYRISSGHYFFESLRRSKNMTKILANIEINARND
jgi:hypothetical protein